MPKDTRNLLYKMMCQKTQEIYSSVPACDAHCSRGICKVTQAHTKPQKLCSGLLHFAPSLLCSSSPQINGRACFSCLDVTSLRNAHQPSSTVAHCCSARHASCALCLLHSRTTEKSTGAPSTTGSIIKNGGELGCELGCFVAACVWCW